MRYLEKPCRYRSGDKYYHVECQSSPDGARAQYRIPVIRMQEYGLDEIFMKGLLCLFPYYIMRYEDSLHDINEDDEKLGNLLAEYQEIYSRLWTLERERQISL